MRKKFLFNIILITLPALSFQTAYSQEDSVGVIEELIEEAKVDEEDKEYYFVDKQYRDLPPQPDVRRISNEEIEKMKNQKAFWYVNSELEEKIAVENPGSGTYIPLTQRTWFQTLVWLLIIGGFAAFLMIYLTGNRVGLFRRKGKTLAGEDAGEEEMPEDIFAINYQREIDKAVSQGNFRLAVRLMYLRMLKNFSDRGIIRYSQEKTNFDYLLQLHPTGYYEDFFRITRNYEYSWYGKFELNERGYELIRKDFDKIERTLI